MRKWLAHLVLIAIYLFFLLPLYWVVAMSFMTNQQILTYPPQFAFSPTLANYKALVLGQLGGGVGTLKVDYLHNFINSLIVSCGAVGLSLVAGIPAAYALARYRFRGADNWAFTLLSFRFAPALLILIPLLQIYRSVGLYNTYWGLILAYQLITLPFIVWIVRGYFEDVSPELEFAARLDGYGWWRSFWHVSLPLVKPGVVAAALLAFIYAWNNFIFALVLGSSDVQPVTVAMLSFMTASGIQYGVIAAALVISVVPILLLAVYAQRFLVRGLSMGAIKG
ncbi:binding-protein-dependent transport systems inner membrane component [Thermobaculum terrenum ATCC BAA-798]|uniref:Binding-protein-dependent transport systems inner membrane component n=1 Tax=Thermobaculum terrenum (strain ATCC BAA-798 / CCMEE 7001 / YNP1) TaxID=525904 RepID=D1CI09_THET1|nr:carbohydrate ABC transporter permease [Thermobaculum terrenum]ACZ43380.1 binding-protein-dependent transport systems inner membrane component [Thermobaculum terrenum ATCC BAA-798]